MNQFKRALVLAVLGGVILTPFAAAAETLSKERVDEIKRKLAAGFKDPSSVQFRNFIVYGSEPKYVLAVCGEVNGKNSYGGYVGFKQFFSVGEDLITVADSKKNAQLVQSMWDTACTGNVLYQE